MDNQDEEKYPSSSDQDIIDITNIIKKSEAYSEKETKILEKPKLTENLYLTRKETIDIIKKNKKIKNPTEFELYTYSNKKIKLFSNDQKWEYRTFDTEISKKEGNYKVSRIEEQPLITNEKWSEADILNFSNNNGFEIRNLIFRSFDCINYNIANIEITTSFSLKGGSNFWIFLHCLNNIFENECSIIQITKIEKSQKAFISLGIILGEKNEYKVFTKQQLVSFNKLNDIQKKNEDLMDFKLIILDSGDGDCKINVFINNSNVENSMNCDFFYPVFDDRRILFAGSGSQCSIKSFECISMIKPIFGKQYYSIINKENNQMEKNDCCYLI